MVILKLCLYLGSELHTRINSFLLHAYKRGLITLNLTNLTLNLAAFLTLNLIFAVVKVRQFLSQDSSILVFLSYVLWKGVVDPQSYRKLRCV